MLHTIDSWILDKFERFSRWTQTWFGLTSVTWERMSLLLSLIFIVVKEFEWDIAGHHKVLIFIDGCIAFWLIARAVGAEYMRAAGLDTMNEKKLTEAPARLLCLFIIAIVAYQDVTQFRLCFEFSTLALYFCACDDLPPGMSRVKKFFQSLAPTRLTPQESNS